MKALPEPAARSAPPARRAFLTIEALGAIGLSVVLMGIFMLAVVQVAAARRESDTRRLLRFAAQAEINCLRAGVSADQVRLATSATGALAEVKLTTETSLGQDAWEGLTHVCVTARKHVRGERWAEFELATYLPGVEPQEPQP